MRRIKFAATSRLTASAGNSGGRLAELAQVAQPTRFFSTECADGQRASAGRVRALMMVALAVTVAGCPSGMPKVDETPTPPLNNIPTFGTATLELMDATRERIDATQKVGL